MRTFFLFFSLLGNCEYNLYASNQELHARDSIIIKQTLLNEKDNSFCFILIYKNENKEYEVYKKPTKDYSIEFKYSFSYSDFSKSYKCYNIYDLGTGIVWSILFNEKSKIFYITEPYDKRALGDFIEKKSVSFEKEEVIIESNENKKVNLYRIKLIQIWPRH